VSKHTEPQTNHSSALPVFVISLLFVFYFWTAFSSRHLSEANYSLFNDLSNGFRNGHLHLATTPDPRLLNLIDPYDPILNQPYRLHDASLYNGRYYSYFGPVAALVLYLPAQMLGFELHAWQVSFLLGCALLAISIRILKLLFTSQMSKHPVRFTGLIVLLSFGSITPILLRRPAMYEVAILSGTFLLMFSLYFLIKGYQSTKLMPRYTSLAIFFAALSFWSRPSHLFSMLIVFSFSIFFSRRNLNQVIFFAAEFFFLLTVIGLYNYLRFQSLTEFGTSYQLSGFNSRNLPNFSRSWIAPKVIGDLFTQPDISSKFPWLRLGRSKMPTALEGAIEPSVGLLYIYPWLLFVFPSFAILLRKFKSDSNRFQMTILLLGAFALGSFSVQTLAAPGITIRYLADYGPFIVLTCALLFCKLHVLFYKHKALINWGLTVSTTSTVLVVFCLSLIGYYNPLGL
jgi:hypothetical protein